MEGLRKRGVGLRCPKMAQNGLKIATTVDTLEEFLHVLVRCAAVYARSADPSTVAEGLAMLVERMEASPGMQRLREALTTPKTAQCGLKLVTYGRVLQGEPPAHPRARGQGPL